jgi:type IV secretion system protein VirB6
MTCPDFTGAGASAIADALGMVDCRAGAATAIAFSRLFGGEGLLTSALTLALTLYVGIFAIGLLTGRTRFGIGTLTPRMILLGLALTFATSWLAYSAVVWNLLAGGPDWIASTMLGTKGSAAHVFAMRLDAIFQQVADAAEQAGKARGDAKGLAPADLLSYAALLLLLGTVGVLVCCRIVLATLLAVGPVFIVMTLFGGTRGLFEGWLKAAVQFALAPMFATLIGVGSLAMLEPVVADLAGGDVTLQQAAMVFVAAAIHCVLMALALKLVSTLVSGWRLPWSGEPGSAGGIDPESQRERQVGPAFAMPGAVAAPAPRDERLRAVISAVSAPTAMAPWPVSGAMPGYHMARGSAAAIAPFALPYAPMLASGSRTRALSRAAGGATHPTAQASRETLP